MAIKSQSYANHTRWFPPFHFFVVPVLLLNVLNAVRHLWLAPSRSTGFAALVAAAIFMAALLTRVMVSVVQDRVIRLEMRLRLAQVLPADLHGRILDLTPQQLVALRFASDPELPVLVRDVLAGKYGTKRAIKQQVKNWQADWLRA
jgi:Family of unknown function (DUF6526)